MAAPEVALSEYVGTYQDGKGQTLEIIHGVQLFAVIDEAKYPLKALGGDAFATRSGDRVQFFRGPEGQVAGYRVGPQSSQRLSPHVTAASAALAWPRPATPGQTARYEYTAPPTLPDGLLTGDAAQSPLGRARAQQLVQGVLDGTWPDIHSVLIHQGGRLVLEEYFYGYDRGRTHQMRSATKSVVSALAGIAAGQPRGAQAQSHVLPRLPYPEVAQLDPRKDAITLEHLLTMRSGLACNDHDAHSPGRETAIYETEDWVQATLALPLLDAPGSTGRYCSGGVAVVGRVVERATGLSLPEFAHQALFEPLGMARSDWRWNYQLTRANREYSQLHLRPRDLLKFGLLYLHKGKWAGKQIIPAAWIEASLQAHSKVSGTDYGYFWWRPWLNVQTENGLQPITFNAAQGNGGQKIYLLPQYDLVVVFTGGDYNSGSSPPNKIMASLILPAMLPTAAR